MEFTKRQQDNREHKCIEGPRMLLCQLRADVRRHFRRYLSQNFILPYVVDE